MMIPVEFSLYYDGRPTAAVRRCVPTITLFLLCSFLFGATGTVLAKRPESMLAVSGAQDFYHKGVELLQANKVEEAATQFRQAIKAFPQFAGAYNLLGICYLRTGKLELASQAFLEAVHFGPQSSEAHNNLGLSYLALGKEEQAADQFQESAALNPNDPSPLFNLGRTRLQMKQATLAVAALSRAESLSSHDTRISLALGEAYFMAGEVRHAQTVMSSICSSPDGIPDFQFAAGTILLKYQHLSGAKECFLRAAAKDPSVDEKILSMASHLVDEGDYQMALGILLSLKQRLDGSATYYDLIGSAYSRLGQPTQAIESLERALQLDSRNENYYLDLGRVLYENGHYGATIELFNRGISVHPQSARLYVGLALAYIAADRRNEAREAAGKAMVLEPTLEPAYTTLAIVYEAQKDWQSLLRDGLQLEMLNPQNYWGWYYQALAQMEMRRSDQLKLQIVLALRRAIELKPTFALAYYQLGKLSFQEKDYRESIVELNRAIALSPDYPDVHYLLAMAFRRVGDLQHSREQLEIHRRLTTEIESAKGPHRDVKVEEAR